MAMKTNRKAKESKIRKNKKATQTETIKAGRKPVFFEKKSPDSIILRNRKEIIPIGRTISKPKRVNFKESLEKDSESLTDNSHLVAEGSVVSDGQDNKILINDNNIIEDEELLDSDLPDSIQKSDIEVPHQRFLEESLSHYQENVEEENKNHLEAHLQKFPDKSSDYHQESIVDQIFNNSPKKYELKNINFDYLKDAIINYKKDSKNFFTGHVLGRTWENGRWYGWSKELMDKVDKNEVVMNQALLNFGHKNIAEIMEKGCDFLRMNDSIDTACYWNMSLEEKNEELLEGLKSVRNSLKVGMMTKWGRIKNRGYLINSASQYCQNAKNVTKKNKDLVDYAKHKETFWNEHYKRTQEKDVFEEFYTK